MKRNREHGSEVLQGDHSYVLEDSVADALIVDGHAVLLQVLPDAKKEEVPKAKSEPAKVEKEERYSPKSEPEPEADEPEESVTKRKKK